MATEHLFQCYICAHTWPLWLPTTCHSGQLSAESHPTLQKHKGMRMYTQVKDGLGRRARHYYERNAI